MKHVLLSLSLVAGIGCGGGDSGDGDTGGSASSAESFQGAALREPSGTCPSLGKQGEKSFTSDGIERTAIIRFPKDPAPGLPVIFVWHGLGDSAAGIDGALQLESFARQNDAIVVVPQSTDPMLITWDIFDGGSDAVLFDDLRACLVNELGADIERVSTTGFSFGALFATWLTLERSDALSAVVTMSGGTDAGMGLGYRQPVSPVPVLVMFGGESDTFSNGFAGVDFYGASLEFSAGLRADGHLVAHCDHGLGHTLPGDYEQAMRPWLLEHRFGADSPFAGALDGFPSYCRIP